MKYISRLKQNLLKLRREQGLRQDDLAQAARRFGPDITRSNIASLETRDNPTTDVMKAIALAKALGVTVEQLVLGELKTSATINDKPADYSVKTDELITIDFFTESTRSRHDFVNEPVNRNKTVNISVNINFIDDLPTNTGVDNLKMLLGKGYAMSPMFGRGDLLIVDTGVNSADSDGVYFFRIGDQYYIKILELTPTGIRSVSKNTDYTSWMIGSDDDFEVLARVLKVWEAKLPV